MFALLDLPYALDALAPVISARTLEFHHGIHLRGYVDNLNTLISDSEFASLPLEEIVRKASGPIFNNAGQILNHNLYFTQFCPASSVKPGPTGHLKTQIEKQWGNLDAFKKEFVHKGVSLFGSGWVWLQADATTAELAICQYAGADNPVVHGFKPILTFDVWEHAYYLDYQNRRASHLDALWSIMDWEAIDGRFVSRIYRQKTV